MDRMRGHVEARPPAAPVSRQPLSAPRRGPRLRPGALLAVLTMALGLALSAPQPAQAQTPGTPETLLTSLTHPTTSTGSCQGYAAGFTTGPAGATLDEVQIRTSSTAVEVEIRENDGGNPSASVLYQMTYASISGGVATFDAPANADLSASTAYWLVVPRGSPGNCFVVTTGVTYSTLHGWSGASGVGQRYNGGSGWGPSPSAIPLAIVGTVHSGPAHQPQASGDSDYEPLRPCTEEERNRRQRPGEWPPPECRGGFLHAWEIPRHLISDPCDQPWQVPGSYRPERGCLERPAGSYSYSGPTGPREVPSPPPEPVYEWFPVDDANGNCCISERRRVR